MYSLCSTSEVAVYYKHFIFIFLRSVVATPIPNVEKKVELIET